MMNEVAWNDGGNAPEMNIRYMVKVILKTIIE